MEEMGCLRCSVCGREIPSSLACSLVTDWGRVYESCFCVCEECRKVLVERGDLNLWSPGTIGGVV
jgi:hypothetical protein